MKWSENLSKIISNFCYNRINQKPIFHARKFVLQMCCCIFDRPIAQCLVSGGKPSPVKKAAHQNFYHLEDVCGTSFIQQKCGSYKKNQCTSSDFLLAQNMLKTFIVLCTLTQQN